MKKFKFALVVLVFVALVMTLGFMYFAITGFLIRWALIGPPKPSEPAKFLAALVNDGFWLWLWCARIGPPICKRFQNFALKHCMED
jgi:hypothetical protein